MALSPEALKAKREYASRWREKNREAYNENMRIWRKNNPDKVRQYYENHWEKLAQEQG